MFRTFYGLTEKPFDIIPNPGILYRSEKHNQALTYLRYGFSENIGFILFTGEIGTGKTTLIKYLLTELTDDVEVAVVFNTNVNAEELLRLILIELEVEGVGQDKSKNLDLLNQHLIEVYSQGRRCLLIIDEAQNLSSESLEEVRLLSNLQTDTQPLLQIILAGQPELRDIIQGPGLEQLAQRVAISYHLVSLSREEMGEYVRYRLEKAGAKDGNLFDEDALDLLHEYTGGIPRSVNVMCNAALVYGYADSMETISRDVIKLIIDDNIGIDPHRAGTPATISPAGAAAAEGLSEEHLRRIAQLESQVAKLVAQVNWQSGQVDGSLAKGNDKLVKSLTELLEKERVRSERYFGRCIALFHKNRMLKQQLDELSGRETMDSIDEHEEKERKKGFLHSLFGAFTF
ncbi:ExeA family protein [Pseudodesulfovibrio portus]|uniref:ATPase n=1 Tax=Pseudodesulfovibrio portus TaxID=231439 RepID=A0ABN6RVD8_9BACT|nr:AAA family ATPase [Pseudodesulfovibrio portus]BDQ33460.1 ATPase [Pseudodesulfovibrio portus]